MATPDQDRGGSCNSSNDPGSLAPGFLQQPTEEDLRVPDALKRELKSLEEWEQRSLKTEWILGEPLGR